MTKHIFSFPLGDWSGDGHRQVDWFRVEVDEKFTEEVLAAQYQKNKELFGFGLRDFAMNYEDSEIPEKFVKTLKEHGFSASEKYENGEDFALYKGKHYVEENIMEEVVMFFLGYGLEDFEYRFVKPEVAFTLFDGPETEYSIGYGLYY